ncbi:MAG: 4-hydroxy-3-methylbut-2-enyl diphosphate reductase [Clostridia bacterium]|nr:4-hydroxy-3-methylbut-2-enyl diphosphate reductase [Clostridia bacterium]
MELILGKTAGFCYGVKTAVEKSIETIKNNGSTCCLGEIVHNKKVVKEIKDMGMHFIDKLEENTEKVNTIIRAHGVSKKIYDDADKNNIKLIDLTCPNVLKIHKIVSDYKEKDYYIFLIGTKLHPETIGTAGFCGEHFSIIEDQGDLQKSIESLKKSKKENLLVAVQTTFSLDKFLMLTDIIKNDLKNDIKNIEIANTICNATKTRQEETEQISKKVDYMIIIGGKNSSNTKKLYEIAKKNCNNTICIESYKEIEKNNIKDKNIIGIMAGASTPQSSIDEVIELVKNT